MSEFKLTKKFIKDIIRYEPDTGHIYWIEPRQGRCKEGPAGHFHAGGKHIQLCIAGKYHQAHHIIWLLLYGKMPTRKQYIKHLNGDRSDNRLSNLKLINRKST